MAVPDVALVPLISGPCMLCLDRLNLTSGVLQQTPRARLGFCPERGQPINRQPSFECLVAGGISSFDQRR
jgi:hypothetical protein